MMTERGVAVDHSTIYRWAQRFAPEMEKRLWWRWRRPRSLSWRIDEIRTSPASGRGGAEHSSAGTTDGVTLESIQRQMHGRRHANS